jgi:hypothetical protein
VLPVLSRSGAAVRLRGPAAVLTRCRTAVRPCGRAAVLPCGWAARRLGCRAAVLARRTAVPQAWARSAAARAAPGGGTSASGPEPARPAHPVPREPREQRPPPRHRGTQPPAAPTPTAAQRRRRRRRRTPPPWHTATQNRPKHFADFQNLGSQAPLHFAHERPRR